MPRNKPDIAPHMARFVAMLENAFAQYGVKDGLPAPIRDAVQAEPRHRFVHRYRVGDGPLRDFADHPTRHLATIYSDQVLRHVAADGVPLPSSNSQPSYILWLLHLLDLQPDHRVLEIGSGSGWLAAVMAHLVGPRGHVTGIEIITDLAAQSQADLAAANLENVTILAQDGTAGHPAGAPFDRVIITAATWDLPVVLFQQVADGGCVLVPIELRGTDGCQVTLLRRAGTRFVAERSVPGWFVPLIGAGQARTDIHRALDSLPFWARIAAAPVMRCKFPVAPVSDRAFGLMSNDFRAFLGRTEPGFALFPNDKAKDEAARAPASAFGLVDEQAGAAALCRGGELLAYGSDIAARRLARAFAQWIEHGLPAAAAFQLEIGPGDDAPVGSDCRWVEQRAHTALIWTLSSDAAAWRSLLVNNAETTGTP